jgi:hypothetical protein
MTAPVNAVAAVNDLFIAFRLSCADPAVRGHLLRRTQRAGLAEVSILRPRGSEDRYLREPW